MCSLGNVENLEKKESEHRELKVMAQGVGGKWAKTDLSMSKPHSTPKLLLEAELCYSKQTPYIKKLEKLPVQ